MKKLSFKIAVFLGGISAERDVSLVTGYNIAKALHENGHNVDAFDVAFGPQKFDFHASFPDLKVKPLPPDEYKMATLLENIFSAVEYVKTNKYDLVFIALHGGYGENGQLQTLLELSEIPFTGSGSISSALCMDKHYSKILVEKFDVPVAKWETFFQKKKLKKPEYLEYPLVVKPNDQGSTVGLSIVNSNQELKDAIILAFNHSNSIMLEEFIPGKELTVTILGNKALPTIEIKPESGFYDYEAKYQSGKTIYDVPAGIPNEINKKIENWALKAYKILKCRHYARVDFRYNPDRNELFFLEVNTLPGMTPTSLVPKAAKAVGIDFNQLLDRIVELVFK